MKRFLILVAVFACVVSVAWAQDVATVTMDEFLVAVPDAPIRLDGRMVKGADDMLKGIVVGRLTGRSLVEISATMGHAGMWPALLQANPQLRLEERAGQQFVRLELGQYLRLPRDWSIWPAGFEKPAVAADTQSRPVQVVWVTEVVSSEAVDWYLWATVGLLVLWLVLRRERRLRFAAKPVDMDFSTSVPAVVGESEMNLNLPAVVSEGGVPAVRSEAAVQVLEAVDQVTGAQSALVGVLGNIQHEHRVEGLDEAVQTLAVALEGLRTNVQVHVEQAQQAGASATVEAPDLSPILDRLEAMVASFSRPAGPDLSPELAELRDMVRGLNRQQGDLLAVANTILIALTQAAIGRNGHVVGEAANRIASVMETLANPQTLVGPDSRPVHTIR